MNGEDSELDDDEEDEADEEPTEVHALMDKDTGPKWPPEGDQMVLMMAALVAGNQQRR